MKAKNNSVTTNNVVNPKNVTLKMVASGEIDYMRKDAICAANRIITENMENEFEEFRSKDPFADESVCDLLDTIANFPMFNAEVILYGTFIDLGEMQFFGMKKEESILAMYVFSKKHTSEEMNKSKFKIRGIKGRLSFNDYLFHQCFAKGIITVDELINLLDKH